MREWKRVTRAHMTPLAKNNLAAPNIQLGDRGSLSNRILLGSQLSLEISFFPGEEIHLMLQAHRDGLHKKNNNNKNNDKNDDHGGDVFFYYYYL